MTKQFYTNEDTARYVEAVLHSLGAGKLNTFDNRLKTQKMQYLAQLFGITPTYSYNLYWRGPYSPHLSKDLFALQEVDHEPATVQFTITDLARRYKVLQEFVSTIKTNRQLELVVTMHWFSARLGLSEQSAFKKLLELKDADRDECEYSKCKVEEMSKCLNCI